MVHAEREGDGAAWAAAAREVAGYYDGATRLFLAADRSRSRTIHRRVYAPGVTGDRAAAEHVHEVLADAIRPLAPPGAAVLDLGSGVGETCFHLAGALGVHATGITISAVQHELAERAAALRAEGARCRFVRGDFMHLGAALGEGTFRAAVAIESFVHAPDAPRFFAEVAAVLEPGARLFVCDDFLTPAAPAADPLVAALRRGWHASSLVTTARARELAAVHGLELERDLDFTPYLALQPRPVLAALALAGRALSALPRVGRSAFAANWIGGTALQQCQSRGWVEYRLLTFARGAGSAARRTAPRSCTTPHGIPESETR